MSASLGPARAGDTVPLGVAVQDVVPRDRVVVYAPSADMSASVHRPSPELNWEQKVKALAAEVGLDVRDDGRLVVIGPAVSPTDETARKAWIESITALPPDTEPLKVVEGAEEEASRLGASSPAVSAPAVPTPAPAVSTPAPEVVISPAPAAPVSAAPVVLATPAAEVSAPLSPPVRDAAAPVTPERRAEAPQVVAPAPVLASAPASTPASGPAPAIHVESEGVRPGFIASSGSNPPAARLVEGTLMSQPTRDRPLPAAKPGKVVLPPAAASASVSVAGRAPLAAVINGIKPQNYDVVYASDVDRAALVPVPSDGAWQQRLNVVAESQSLRIEATEHTLFVKHAPSEPVVSEPVASEPVVVAEVAPLEGVGSVLPDTAPVVSSEAAPAKAPVIVEVPDTARPAPPVTPAEKAAVAAAPVAPDMSEVAGSNQPSQPLPSASAPTEEAWRAERGSSLHDVLATWCKRAGVQLVWSSQFDYPLQASIALNDSFEGAVRTILAGFASAAPRPVGRLHRQANFGMRVLVIQTNGNRYGE